jgi:hypothetical protein
MNFSGPCSLLYLAPPQSTSPANVVEAIDVSFDPGPSGVVSTNVQDAIDELASRPMEVDRLGLCFGKQDIPNNTDAYGHLSKPGLASLTIYSPSGPGTPQKMNLVNSTVIVNNTSDDAGCTVDETLLIANGALIQGVDLTRCVAIINKVPAMGNDFRGSVLLGCMVDSDLQRAPGGIFVLSDSNSGNIVTFDGKFAGYIGNGSVPVTVRDHQWYISGYNDFYLQTLSNASAPYVVFYDPSSGRTTYDIPPPASVSQKQSLAIGATYGFVSNVSNSVENVGYRNLQNFQVSNPALINNAVCVGQNLFSNLVTGGGASYKSCVTLGTSLSLSPNATLSNSFLVANGLSSAAAMGVSNCIVLAPKLNSITVGGAPANPLENSIAICPQNLTFIADTAFSAAKSNTLTISTGNCVMGSRNLIISRNPTNMDANQTNINGGHVFLSNLETPYAIGIANPFKRNILLLTDDITLPVPVRDDSLVCNSKAFYISLVPAIALDTFTTIEGSQIRPLLFNTNNKKVVPPTRTIGGYGMGPLTYNYKLTATLALGGIRQATLTVPNELRDPTLLPTITVNCSTQNPGGVGNTGVLFTAQYMGIVSNNMRFNAYEQAIGGPLAHASVDTIIDVTLSV